MWYTDEQTIPKARENSYNLGLAYSTIGATPESLAIAAKTISCDMQLSPGVCGRGGVYPYVPLRVGNWVRLC